MTSARDAPRGKGDVAIGISKVPDARLDRAEATPEAVVTAASGAEEGALHA